MEGMNLVISGGKFPDSPSFEANYTTEMSSYTHTIDAFGGYKTADVSIACDVNSIEDWLENGLARHVTAYSPVHLPVWEGFVNKVSVAFGGRNVEVGPLMDVINKVAVMYSFIETTSIPPVVGTRKITSFAEDSTSRLRYGYIEEIMSIAGSTDGNAIYLRDLLLQEYRQPITTQTISFESSDPVVTISCLGYVEYLNHFFYRNVGSGTQDADAAITAVLAADPNLLTEAYLFDQNTLQIPIYENEYRKGLEIIRSIVARGDAAARRWLFGVYEYGRAVYQPQDLDYTYQFITNQPSLQLFEGIDIPPWEVKPAKWVFIPDFLSGRRGRETLQDDPRSLFIESVTYTAPYGLSISGGRDDKLGRTLARLGLGGMS